MTTTPSLLTGRRALVTGGSRGIGAGIVRGLAAAGAHVAFTYWSSEDAAHELEQEVRAAGGRAEAIRADASDPTEAAATVQRAVELLGGLDVLVPNAAQAWFEPFADASAEHIEQTLDLNLRGPAYTVQEALRHISGEGRIILISSLSAERAPFPGQTVYGMSKAALTALGRGLARDLGATGSKVTVNVVQPGPVDTHGNPATTDFAPAMTAITALGRYGTPDEIANLVVWLASAESSYMTGSVINIDGGVSA
ncbi:SDR family NAD(P)-dependent oxidoreductase [Curtobacterium sp. ME26]|uniref:SDR family NAD(P)-dependent oxidoreductase n=1 Tax=Curtobacterium sp. ME26 TaxID=2744254 RepID=UPI0015F56C4B|nr:SDR family oxidoreductase [Curtobacterium sp. ME26]